MQLSTPNVSFSTMAYFNERTYEPQPSNTTKLNHTHTKTSLSHSLRPESLIHTQRPARLGDQRPLYTETHRGMSFFLRTCIPIYLRAAGEGTGSLFFIRSGPILPLSNPFARNPAAASCRRRRLACCSGMEKGWIAGWLRWNAETVRMEVS